MSDDKKFKGEYGVSEQGNFEVIDSIGVPHPYCIGAAHLKYNDCMMLGTDQIRRMEKEHPHHVHCKVKGCTLSYDEHEQALVVACKADMVSPGDGKKACPELHNYLLKAKDEATKNGYTGFAFLDKRGA